MSIVLTDEQLRQCEIVDEHYGFAIGATAKSIIRFIEEQEAKVLNGDSINIAPIGIISCIGKMVDIDRYKGMRGRTPTEMSHPLRDSARGRDCTIQIAGICNHDPKTVVLAHIYIGPKAMAGKGDDLHGAFACSACHAAIDGQQIDRAPRYAYLLGGLIRTQEIWRAEGFIAVADEAQRQRAARPSKVMPRRFQKGAVV